MDILNIYLPVAGIEFNILLLIVIGFCVGVLGGFFGVGGAWIVTPALNIFGFHMSYAIGTDLAHIFGKSIIATKKHSKMGNVDWKLGLISIGASVLGVEAGSQIIMILEKVGNVGSIVRWSYIILLLGLSIFMLYDYFIVRPQNDSQNMKVSDDKKSTNSKKKKIPLSSRLHKIKIPPMVSFPTSGIESVSLWIVLFIFFITGFLSGFMGVGGGFIRMPALVYLIGCPTAIAVGTDLMSVLFSGAYGCLTYAIKGRVEIIAAVFMLLGASIGAQLGVTAVKYIRGYGIRLLFAIMIAFAGVSVVIEQVYKMTDIPIYSSIAGTLVIGASILMTLVICTKLFIEVRKEKRLQL
ncbi:MAG: sulfite exporter TauE/SafE family protein [Ignavibacteriaceae bacterium]